MRNLTFTLVVLALSSLISPVLAAADDFGSLNDNDVISLGQRIALNNPTKVDKWSSTEQTRHYRLDGVLVFKFLEGQYKELRDSSCVRNFLKTPGHMARIAAGFYIQALFLSIRYVEGETTELRVTPVYKPIPDKRVLPGDNSSTKAASTLVPEFNCGMRS